MGPLPAPNDGADVYVRDTRPRPGPWTVQNILDPSADATTPQQRDGFQACTLLIYVEDNPGVLNEVTGVVARRGYNIQSLAVGNSETPGFSRITTVLPGEGASMRKLMKQLEKLVVVQSVRDLTEVPHVARELMLVKVRPACFLGLMRTFDGYQSECGGTQPHAGEDAPCLLARGMHLAFALGCGVCMRMLSRSPAYLVCFEVVDCLAFGFSMRRHLFSCSCAALDHTVRCSCA